MAEGQDKKSATAPSCCCSPVVETPVSVPGIGVSSGNIGFGPWVVGHITTAAGEIPVVSTALESADRRGAYKARWGIGRMNYRVQPGLYAVGRPTAKSQVFVSANYKMSFDHLRSRLGGSDAWLLVLDTRGINVWCAAGKGTFGTDELVKRVIGCRLNEIVSHRRLIVPQLGAPGIAAHTVKERTGFRVVYGPVRAADLAAFLAAGFKATPEMRRVTFNFFDRIALVPNELVHNLKYPLPAAACFLVFSGFGPGVYAWERVVSFGLVNALLVLAVYLAGSIIPAALLPWLPGRAFAVKGAWFGLVCALILGVAAAGEPGVFRNTLAGLSWFLMIPAATSFIAMNFTGCSTYTSLSGVQREMRVAVPVQAGVAVAGLGLWTAGLFI